MTQPCRKNPHKVGQETNAEINQRRRGNDFGKWIRRGKFRQRLALDDQTLREGAEGGQSTFLAARKSPGQAPFRRVQGRAAAGQDEEERGAQQS